MKIEETMNLLRRAGGLGSRGPLAFEKGRQKPLPQWPANWHLRLMEATLTSEEPAGVIKGGRAVHEASTPGQAETGK